MHEAQLYEHNAYITVTYDDEHLPPGHSLVYRDFQLFMKRARKHFAPAQIRFYMSGEYGEKTNRPHYHALLFNANFKDRKYFRTMPSGAKLYTSETLDKLWGKGHTTIGAVTFESAAYVARYVMKKITGLGIKTYKKIDQETGEITNEIGHQGQHNTNSETYCENRLAGKKIEFSNMSRRPGIGEPWIEKYKSDVYPHGMVVINGHEVRPPKYYDRWYKKRNPRRHAAMIDKRLQEARDNFNDNTNSRLAAKQTVTNARLSKLKRTL